MDSCVFQDNSPCSTANGNRLLVVDFLYFSSNRISITKIENNSHVHDKRETTHFDLDAADSKSGIFAVRWKNN